MSIESERHPLVMQVHAALAECPIWDSFGVIRAEWRPLVLALSEIESRLLGNDRRDGGILETTLATLESLAATLRIQQELMGRQDERIAVLERAEGTAAEVAGTDSREGRDG